MKLAAHNISSGYERTPAIRDVTLTVGDGEVVGVLGPNGSGKTTLFRTLLRFLPLMSGSVTIDGADTRTMRAADFARKVSYIPQSNETVFPYTVTEMAMMGRACHVPMFGVPDAEDQKIVEQSLDMLGISGLRDRRFTELSGGQQRLVLIARAISQQARILIMDEPSSDLDYANQQLVQNTILDLKAQGYGIVLSTHAPEYPYSIATKVLLLNNGSVVSSGSPDEALTPETLTQAFGVPMDVISVTDSSGKERKMCVPL